MGDVVNLSDYFRFLFALGIVIGIILLLAILLRRFGSGFPSSLNKGRRLGISESMPLDAKHRLVLIKRDDVEHLVILGHTTDTLIEKNIIPPILTVSDSDEDTDSVTISKPSIIKNNRFKDLLSHMKSIQK